MKPSTTFKVGDLVRFTYLENHAYKYNKFDKKLAIVTGTTNHGIITIEWVESDMKGYNGDWFNAVFQLQASFNDSKLNNCLVI
jgi:hypothetical protein